MYKSLVLHIPHTSSLIPDNTILLNDEQKELVLKQTDTNTDILFIPKILNDNIKPIIFKYNRYYCDVERYWCDDLEAMSKIGQGVYYIKDLNGNDLNRLDLKDDIKVHYDNHHELLLNSVNASLNDYGDTLIIDCHSFNDDFILDTILPDICLGFNTHTDVVDIMKDFFLTNGYTVELNYPYKGSILPNGDINKNHILDTIMIEINKRFYLNNNVNIQKFNDDVNILYNILLNYV